MRGMHSFNIINVEYLIEHSTHKQQQTKAQKRRIHTRPVARSESWDRRKFTSKVYNNCFLHLNNVNSSNFSNFFN